MEQSRLLYIIFKTLLTFFHVHRTNGAPLAEAETDTDSVGNLSLLSHNKKSTIPARIANKPANLVLTDSEDDDSELINDYQECQNKDKQNAPEPVTPHAAAFIKATLDDILQESIERSLTKINHLPDNHCDLKEYTPSPPPSKVEAATITSTSTPLSSSIVAQSIAIDTNVSVNDHQGKAPLTTSPLQRNGSLYENEHRHVRCDLAHDSARNVKVAMRDQVAHLDRFVPKSSSPYYVELLKENLEQVAQEAEEKEDCLDKVEAKQQQQKSSPVSNGKNELKVDIVSQPTPVAAHPSVSPKFPEQSKSRRLVHQPESDATSNGTASTSNDSSSIMRRNRSSNSINASQQQRPLTLYMPSPNQPLDLITHLHALGHDLTSTIVTNNLLLTPSSCSGYLYKQCASSTHKWRKRYFHFNRLRKVFVYFQDRHSFEKRKHPKRKFCLISFLKGFLNFSSFAGGVFFDDIQDVYVDHTRINVKKFNKSQQSREEALKANSGNDLMCASMIEGNGHHRSMFERKKFDGTRCVFVVSTTNRKFTLSTYIPELMRIWMDVIFTGANAYLLDFDSMQESQY